MEIREIFNKRIIKCRYIIRKFSICSYEKNVNNSGPCSIHEFNPANQVFIAWRLSERSPNSYPTQPSPPLAQQN